MLNNMDNGQRDNKGDLLFIMNTWGRKTIVYICIFYIC